MSEAQSQIARYLRDQGQKPTYGNISGVLRALQTNPGLIPSLVVGPTEDSSPRATSNAPPQARAQTQRGSAPTRPVQQSPAPTSSQSPAAAAADAAGRGNADAPSRSFTEPQGAASGPVPSVSAQTTPQAAPAPASGVSGGSSIGSTASAIADAIFGRGTSDLFTGGANMVGRGVGSLFGGGSGGSGGGASAAPVAPVVTPPVTSPVVTPPAAPPAASSPGPAQTNDLGQAAALQSSAESSPVSLDGIKRAMSYADDALRTGGGRAETFLRNTIEGAPPTTQYQGSDVTQADNARGPNIFQRGVAALPGGGGVRGAPDLTAATAPGGSPIPIQPNASVPLPPAARNAGTSIGNLIQPLADAATGSGQSSYDPRDILTRILAGLGVDSAQIHTPLRSSQQGPTAPGRTPRQPPSRQ